MFATLGGIRFAVVGSPERLTSSRRYDYAELPVVQARPRLQWLADALERIELELMFHASFTEPAVQLAALRAASASHEALALVFGDGTFRGFFVIESVSVSAEQLAANGAPVAVVARVALKEFALDSVLDPGAPPIPIFSPLALVTPSATSTAAPIPHGVTPLLNVHKPSGALSPSLMPDDVPTAVITRTA